MRDFTIKGPEEECDPTPGRVLREITDPWTGEKYKVPDTSFQQMNGIPVVENSKLNGKRNINK
jgi:hypothetical protein